MQSRESFLALIETLLSRHGILSISGPSGSGKTTLAQFITGHLLVKEGGREERAIWVQSSEVFSNKRLETLFQHDYSTLHYLKQNIFIIPGRKSCSNFTEQQLVFNKIIGKESILPPGVKFIVIDNISHHLRFELSGVESIQERSTTINGFFNSLLSPLILLCQREKIYLILIHELSYVPELRNERPFLYKLYDRIRSATIELKNEGDSAKKKMMNISISMGDISHNIEYELCNSGFLFYQVKSI